MANRAFVRCRNKYHVNFNIQADRLASFSWFSMRYLCTSEKYVALADGLLAWLAEGGDAR